VERYDKFKDQIDYIKSEMKKGKFNDSLRIKVDKAREMVARYSDQLKKSDEINYLKIKCLISEVYDYFGDIKKAEEEIKKQGEETFAQLENCPQSIDKKDRKLFRERIRLSLIYSQALFYRRHKYDEFKEKIEVCQKVAKKIINKTDFPCWGTQAQLMYYYARAYRQSNEFDRAEECFAESINFHFNRIEQKREEYEKGPRLNSEPYLNEISFSRYRSAISLGLGLGWVNFTKGHLASALHNNIIPARVLLADTDDQINKAYLDILLGSIKRCRAGNNIAELREAIKIIEGAHEIFAKLKHDRYLARSAYELSLAHLYLSYLYKKNEDAAKRSEEIIRARDRIDFVLKHSERVSDWRWVANALIVQSRIERWEGYDKRAEELAVQAFNIADEHKQTLCIQDARLARGKAKIKLGDLEGAQEDFKKALLMNTLPSPRNPKTFEPRNPRIEAVCCINLARLYVEKKDLRQAEEYFARGKNLLKDVEHVIIHESAKAVEEKIKGLRPEFTIKVEDVLQKIAEHKKKMAEDKEYKGNLWSHYEGELWDFLVYHASSQGTGSDAQAARIMGMTPPTFAHQKKRRKIKKSPI
jgi:hypothetical protein